MKTIKVENPNSLPTVSYEKLEDLQGDLKTLPEENLEKLKRSIRQFGFKIPKFVWIDRGHYFLLDGHQTKKALESLEAEGYTIPEVPYAEVKAKGRQEAAKILLEINSRYGEYNPNTSFFEDFDIDLDFIKDIKIPELDIMLEDFEQSEIVEDVVPDSPAEPLSKPGDLWLCGRHRVLCGDATKEEDVARLMNGKKADMVFTDPPYGINIHNTKGKVKNDNNLSTFKEFQPIFKRYINKKTHIYIFFGSKVAGESLSILNENFKQFNILVFPITNLSQPYPKGYFSSNYELCYFSQYGGIKEHNTWKMEVAETTKKDRRYKGGGFLKKYYALNEYPITEHNLNRIHPTQKKVSTVSFFVFISSQENDIIADFFLGAGTTLIAAEQTGRICYGCEIDPHYIDVILDRYAKFTGDDPIREDGIKWSELKKNFVTSS